jgi:hypothetical protein
MVVASFVLSDLNMLPQVVASGSRWPILSGTRLMTGSTFSRLFFSTIQLPAVLSRCGSLERSVALYTLPPMGRSANSTADGNFASLLNSLELENTLNSLTLSCVVMEVAVKEETLSSVRYRRHVHHTEEGVD